MREDTEVLRTLGDFIRWGASRFNESGLHFGHGTDNALDEAAQLVLHALHLPMDLPSLYFNSVLTDKERLNVIELLTRRVEERVPAAYLTGEAWFAGLPFSVNEHVLIPRSPIAELVENGFHPWIEQGRVNRILDMCTGSGCIGIASALRFPAAEVDLVDISGSALEVATHNAVRHEVDDRVNIIHSDLYSALGGKRYDVIVSNPPYVHPEEIAGLPAEYQKEPALGFYGGADGLVIVERILEQAHSHIQPWGIMVVEVGSSAEQLMRRYPEIPFLWLNFERGGEGVFMLTADQTQAAAAVVGSQSAE